MYIFQTIEKKKTPWVSFDLFLFVQIESGGPLPNLVVASSISKYVCWRFLYFT